MRLDSHATRRSLLVRITEGSLNSTLPGWILGEISEVAAAPTDKIHLVTHVSGARSTARIAVPSPLVPSLRFETGVRSIDGIMKITGLLHSRHWLSLRATCITEKSVHRRVEIRFKYTTVVPNCGPGLTVQLC